MRQQVKVFMAPLQPGGKPIGRWLSGHPSTDNSRPALLFSQILLKESTQ